MRILRRGPEVTMTERQRSLLGASAACILSLWLVALPVNVAWSADDTKDLSLIDIYHDASVKILVADPRGRRAAGDPRTGSGIKEIENSNYLDESTGDPATTWAMYIWGETGGPFVVTATGITMARFSLDIGTCDEKRQCFMETFTGVTDVDRIYTYTVDFSPEPGKRSVVLPATYDFGGFRAPLTAGTECAFRKGEVIPLAFKIARRDGKPADDVVARLFLRPLAEDTSQREPLHQRAPGDLSAAPLFRFDPVRKQYDYSLETENLAIGSWVVVLLLDDGSVEKVHIKLRPW